MYKNFLLGAIGIALAIFTIRTFNQSSETAPDNALIVGTQSGYPPFEFINSSGEIVGFDIDLAKQLAKKLDRPLVIKDMEFEGLILSLKQGKIDLILSGMNITSNRLKEIGMVPYHGDAATSFNLVFWNTIPSGVKTLDDIATLPGGSISVESGSIPEIYMENHPKIHTKSFQGTLSAIMDVKFGKSTANLVQADVAEYLAKKHLEIKTLNVPLPQGAEILGFGIGIKKENQELFQQVKKAISELKGSGEITKLENQWFKGEQ